MIKFYRHAIIRKWHNKASEAIQGFDYNTERSIKFSPNCNRISFEYEFRYNLYRRNSGITNERFRIRRFWSTFSSFSFYDLIINFDVKNSNGRERSISSRSITKVIGKIQVRQFDRPTFSSSITVLSKRSIPVSSLPSPLLDIRLGRTNLSSQLNESDNWSPNILISRTGQLTALIPLLSGLWKSSRMLEKYSGGGQ